MQEVAEKIETEKSVEEPVLNFMGILAMDMVKEETEDGTLFKIFKGTRRNRKFHALFVNERDAIMSMYHIYTANLDMALKDAQAKLKNPEEAASAAEEKASGGAKKAESAEAVPKFAKPRNILE